ncbi:MAG TPA: FHA domain-containing protein [Ktedonobacteraceae bacterium]|nr:FHA domain-containing protein [Ktedonobacteraceae bacterium]
MLAITVNTLYTSLRKRGTPRQLTRAIVLCVISVLLLLFAFTWYNVRFTVKQAGLSTFEIGVALTYVALAGWVLPIGVCTVYCLYTEPQTSSASTRLTRLKWSPSLHKTSTLQPPRYQPGIMPPFVYSEDTPWGWLEYRSGNFQGQRLALKRQIARMGRDEDNDIWIDDEMASRHHAELAWYQDNVYLTDCDSLNGIFLNGRRVRHTTLLKSGDLIEVGSHCFAFIVIEYKETLTDLVDPLANHKWRSAFDEESQQLPVTSLLEQEPQPPTAVPISTAPGQNVPHIWDETAEIHDASPLPQPANAGGALVVLAGPAVGQSFLLDRQTLTVGRGHESDIVLPDSSISRRHVQLSRQGNDDYIQDLGSRNGTRVNDEPLSKPKQLKQGDIISMGNIRLEYVALQSMLTTPIPITLSPQNHVSPLSGPIPLRLPSKPFLPEGLSAPTMNQGATSHESGVDLRNSKPREQNQQ